VHFVKYFNLTHLTRKFKADRKLNELKYSQVLSKIKMKDIYLNILVFVNMHYIFKNW
jgi:hypothetical protein